MDAARVLAVARTFETRSRRRLLSTLSGATLAVGSFAFPVDAKRKKHKKKPCPDCPTCQECPTCPSPPPPLTCAQTCPTICHFCYVRPGATTLCGDAGLTLCDTACTSDADCGGATPFCASQTVNRTTAEVVDVCTTPGAFCVSIPGCAA
jgi:hypothetical protein